MDLALFDSDGTIAAGDCYTDFVKAAVPRSRLLVGLVLLSPLIVAYRAGLLRPSPLRKAISRVAFVGMHSDDLKRFGERFAADVLPRRLIPSAMARISWHQERGDRIVVVSASLDSYLEPWCASHGLEVICTKLEVQASGVTGRYVGGDCCGEAKRQRVLKRINIRDYSAVFAYGDTDEDAEMLSLADHAFLRWEEVDAENGPKGHADAAEHGLAPDG